MYVQLTFELFQHMMKTSIAGNGFSYYGIKRLFEYLEETRTQEDTDDDVTSVGYEFTEYKNAADLWSYFDRDTYIDLETLRLTYVVLLCDNGSILVNNN